MAAEADRDAAIKAAMDRVWDSIRREDSRVPGVSWYLTSGRGSSCSTVSFAEPEPVIRVNLMTDGRNLTGHEVLLNLLHLGAHAIAGFGVNGVWHPVTAQEGRYHPEPFAVAAARLGLDAEKSGDTKHGGTGWSIVSLSVDADRRYRAEIRALDKAMADWHAEGRVRKQTRGALDLVCACTPATLPGARTYPRVIRASSLIALAGKIQCGYCGSEFSIREGQRISEDDRESVPTQATRTRAATRAASRSAVKG
jgi:hypothetical protein